MKRFLLWLLGVACGAALLVGTVFGASYALTGKGALPDGTAAFGGAAITPNGFCWRLPLLGGVLDKTFFSSETLTREKLGQLDTVHPALTLPSWANYGTLEIYSTRDEARVFAGGLSEYAAFAYPAEGEYRAELRLWHLSPGATAAAFDGGAAGSVSRPAVREVPARPQGWYSYGFRFSVASGIAIEVSAETVSQGGVLAFTVSGLFGGEAPAVECDLGSATLTPWHGGWRGYLPVAYNAETGVHTLTVTHGSESAQDTVRVLPHTFGKTVVEPENATDAANTEFRSAIWPLYTASAPQKLWSGAWQCPVSYRGIFVDYGVQKLSEDGKSLGQSNSTTLSTVFGTEVTAPAAGTVVYAGELELTGKTVVIDHGCGVHTFLYGLENISARAGDTLARGQAVGLSGAALTMDFKIGNKSIYPWDLFHGAGGLFWKENE